MRYETFTELKVSSLSKRFKGQQAMGWIVRACVVC